jgi:hypothetical protein
MEAPEILPWIAHRSGISEELALELWRRAASEAEAITGCCNHSDYYGLAVDRFIDFAELEGNHSVVRETLAGETRLSWVWHQQNRISKRNLIALQNLFGVWQAKLNDCFGVRRQAG